MSQLSNTMQITSRSALQKNTVQDRISKLPDDILLLIISKLKLTEAARTSVLSKSWKYIWRFTTGVLDFAKSFVIHEGMPRYMWSSLIEAARFRFIDWVNLVLDIHEGSTIDEFRVCFGLDQRNSNLINCWVKFALKRHVKRLVLDFGCVDIGARHANYALGSQIFSNHGDGLTSLHLNHVEVTGEVLRCILCRFPLIQMLHVQSSSSLTELKIASPLPNLRCLEIIHCPSMRYLEIQAFNLVSFAYRGPKINIYFKEIPQVVEANLDEIFFFKDMFYFPSYFFHLESLVLNLEVLDFTRKLIPKLPLFGKLKRLEFSMYALTLDAYILCCTKLFKASPLLHKFVLKIYKIWNEDTMMVTGMDQYEHKMLKDVEFIGFLGSLQHIKLVRGVLARLPSLEKVFITPSSPSPYRSLHPLDYKRAISKARGLKKWLPPGAQLVLPSERNQFTHECECSRKYIS